MHRSTTLQIAVAGALMSAGPVAASRPPAPDPIPTHPLAVDLPITRQHTYRMAGRVRMLLLWVGREDVGSAVINWRGAGADHAYELLIGSDPSKAPGQLNKWGYLIEEIRGSVASVVGLISQDNEDHLSDVKEGLVAGPGQRPFDTVRGRVGFREAHARVGTLFAASTLTYRDAPAVLKLILEDKSKPMKRLECPGGVRSGFLTSLTELISDTLVFERHGKQSGIRSIPYVHGDRLYDLHRLESTSVARFERDGRDFGPAIRTRFETARAGRRTGTRFEIVYGASGDLRGIPLLVSYQPKWWLQVDLVLQK
jgi:hypothetical protein